MIVYRFMNGKALREEEMGKIVIKSKPVLEMLERVKKRVEHGNISI